MKILMITPRYFPHMGGIETHVHEVGRRLVRLGVDVTLLTTEPQELYSQFPRQSEDEGMRVIRAKAWPPKRDYYIAPEIFSLVKQEAWDLIHCQGCHTFVPPMAMLAARRVHIPYVVTFHTGGHSSTFRNYIRGAQWQLLRPLLAHASGLIGVSHFEAEYFRTCLRLPSRQFRVIPNGATLPALAHSAPSSNTPAHTLIVSVGRLERYKGHQHLIRALPLIRQQRPAARLLILGAGPYETNLRKLARQRGVADAVEIRAVPASDRRSMAETLAQATLVALLSEYEAHPVAVMEALALQRPVLVADTSGLREIAQQGLARAIPLYSTPQEIARAALQQIEQPLIPPAHLALPTWDDCARQLHDTYTTILARRQPCAS